MGLLILLLVIYLLPMIVALVRDHKNSGAISVLNILTGWTLMGWVVSLVWALTN